ncbi:hypothetical protein K1T71_007714 [Dendrolimus kikuchii]|uniref:Uncharacterized protein n=1 Tax=Dendrolimus kikuchii TaxID=765133 RepID=A0ACC1CY27_9NEOP|nr:hypothetical protein K1T71_007714 [Dendrolimus kikuchii]
MSLEKLISKFKSDSDYKVCVSSYDTPLGKIISVADDYDLYTVAFEDSKNCEKMLITVQKELCCMYIGRKNNVLQRFENELSSYFKGDLNLFKTPLKMLGSDFQKSVWEKLLEVPYGKTQTYSDIAKALGRPASHARAVGAACGANAHVIIIPCHRIVATGSNGGYSCGIERKDKLIQLEKSYT